MIPEDGWRSFFLSADPILSEAGRIAARKRWGRRRHVNLTEVPEPVRRAIEAMLIAEEQAQEREAVRDAA